MPTFWSLCRVKSSRLGEEAASSVQSTPLNVSSLSSPLEIETYGSGVHKENGSLKTSPEKPESGTPLAVGQFEAWLLDILCEMLLFLVQVLKALLDVSWLHAWADEVHSHIIQMECNLLYCLPAASVDGVTPSSKPKLDMDQISLLGGIEIICNKSAGVEELQAVATTLALAEAPESFALAFKQGLQGVGGAISKSIVTAMSRDVTNGRLNAQLLEHITRS